MQQSLVFISKIFHHSLKEKKCYSITMTSHFPSLQFVETNLLFVSMDLLIHMLSFVTGFFHNVFKFHLYIKYIVLHSFYGWMKLHCMDIPSFIIHSLVAWPLSCFYCMALMNIDAMNIYEPIFVWIYVFSSLVYIPKSVIPDT